MSKSKIKIADMQTSHIPEIIQLEVEGGLSIWKNSDYQNEIEKTDSLTKVAKTDNKIVGFILARLITPKSVQEQNYAEIYNIAVKKEWRCKGIGSLLIDQLMNVCQKKEITEIFLEVRKSNENARRFYVKKGFKEIAERKSYYVLPIEDAVIMQSKLLVAF